MDKAARAWPRATNGSGTSRGARLIYLPLMLGLVAASVMAVVYLQAERSEPVPCQPAPGSAGFVKAPAILARSNADGGIGAEEDDVIRPGVPWSPKDRGPKWPVRAGAGRSVLDEAPVTPAQKLKVALLTMNVRGEDPRGPNNRTRVVNYSDKTADITDIALANMQAYCDHHGYDLIVIEHSLEVTRPLVWSKLVGMMRYLPDYDWLLYMDGDALFSNFSVSVQDRIRPPEGARCSMQPDVVEFYVAAHAINNSLNSGVMLMKNTPQVLDLLSTVYKNYSRVWNGLQDNRAVINIIANDTRPFICRLMGDYSRVLQTSVHTTSLRIPANYVPGDWIVHFAGPCAPWCRVAAQLVNICATYPYLPECATALTRVGWVPMSSYGKILDPNDPAR